MEYPGENVVLDIVGATYPDDPLGRLAVAVFCEVIYTHGRATGNIVPRRAGWCDLMHRFAVGIGAFDG